MLSLGLRMLALSGISNSTYRQCGTGAFADALGWQYVIPILEKDGYNVIAVEKEFAASLQRRTS